LSSAKHKSIHRNVCLGYTKVTIQVVALMLYGFMSDNL